MPPWAHGALWAHRALCALGALWAHNSVGAHPYGPMAHGPHGAMGPRGPWAHGAHGHMAPMDPSGRPAVFFTEEADLNGHRHMNHEDFM